MDLTIDTYRRIFARYMRPQWRRTLALALLILGGTLLQLEIPKILRGFIDAVEAHRPGSALMIMAAAFLGAGMLNQLLVAASSWLSAHVGWRATNELRADLTAHCLRLDMTFHNDRSPGELIERIDGDVTALATFFSTFVVRIMSAALLVIGVLVQLFAEDWRAGAVLGFYMLIAGTIIYRMRNLAVEASRVERQANAEMFGFVEERLAGIDDIRANGAGGYVVRRFLDVLRNVYRTGTKAWSMRARFWLTMVGIFAIGDVASIGSGIWLKTIGAISLGTVYLFYQYMQMIWAVVEQVTQQMPEMQKAAAGIVRIEELRRIQPTMVDGNGTELVDGPLPLDFENVSFGYADHHVLENITFSLRPGESLGLLGRTGSGKTTLTRLIFRLYDLTDGTIRIAGRDLRELRLTELRRRVAMVTQEVQLFHGTVRDNLTFFDTSVDDARILAVIEELGLAEWFSRLPDGLDTALTAGGGGLSSGEAQLLAFVRVFLQDPGLVVLDEPSSRLDLATERLLERAMRKLLRDRTAIVIAHRLSTVKRADRIMILEGGRIIEVGERAALVRDANSRFARLLRHAAGQDEAPRLVRQATGT